jgi:antitoxin (DNA-binding transcriptional repressor) of toxin-antitoxin stability system
MTVTIGIREARARLAELVDRAEQGETLIITRSARSGAAGAAGATRAAAPGSHERPDVGGPGLGGDAG